MNTEEIRALVETQDANVPETFKLESIQVLSGTHVIPTATVTLETPQGPQQHAASGDGPVDAVYRAINAVTSVYPVLESYRIEAVTENSEALGEVSIRARVGEIVYSGNGVATDIVEASARAWLEVINASIAKVGVKKEAIQAI
jgi:2-isopropylmalate synthase